MILDNRTTVLFDLDGTLLPFEQDAFIQSYFGRLIRKTAPLGYDKDRLVKALWTGTGAMVENDGRALNCDVFWGLFEGLMGRPRADMEPLFFDYYAHEFDGVREVLTETVDRGGLLRALRERGCGVVLATNPIFPSVAVETRLRWAGLSLADFDLVTTYENSRRCKPNPDYFRDILADGGLEAEACVMVGNNALEDMVAGDLGLATFLVTDHLENPEQTDIGRFRHGSFRDMEAWLLG